MTPEDIHYLKLYRVSLFVVCHLVALIPVPPERLPRRAQGLGRAAPIKAYVFLPHTRLGSGSQARCVDDAHYIRGASFPG